MFKFHCPHCQQKLSAEATQSGASLQCPACGVDFVIPSPTDEVVIQPQTSEESVVATSSSEMQPEQSSQPEPSPEPGASHSFAERLRDGNKAAQEGAKFVKKGAMVGWAGLKRRSKQAALKAQIEKLRNIDLRKALHSLGKNAFEQGVVTDGVAEQFQAIRDLDARIAEMRDKAAADAGETKMAALKRVSKDTAKASQAQALTVKREHLITELGREIHARNAQMSTQELSDESAAIAEIEHRIRDKEDEMHALNDGGKSGIQTLSVAAFGILLVAGVIFMTLSHFRKIPEDITNWKSVEYITKRAADQNEVQIRTVGHEEIYFLKGSKSPLTGWINGTKSIVCRGFSSPKRFDVKNLIYVVNGEIDKEWSFYDNTTPECEIIYDQKSNVKKHGVEGVKTIHQWKPDEHKCDETKVENGNGKVLKYDYSIWMRSGGGTKLLGDKYTGEYTVKSLPTEVVYYREGKITHTENLETEEDRKIADVEHRNNEYLENKDRTENEIRLRENMSKAYPEISFNDSKKIADEIFGEIANDLESKQRIRVLESLLQAADYADLDEDQVLKKFMYWRKKYASDIGKQSTEKFRFDTAKMVADNMRSAAFSWADAERTRQSLRAGGDNSEFKVLSAYEIMDNTCSSHITFVKRYPGITMILGVVDKGTLPPSKVSVAKDILTRFEKTQEDDEMDKIEIEAQNFIMANVANR